MGWEKGIALREKQYIGKLLSDGNIMLEIGKTLNKDHEIVIE